MIIWDFFGFAVEVFWFTELIHYGVVQDDICRSPIDAKLMPAETSHFFRC